MTTIEVQFIRYWRIAEQFGCDPNPKPLSEYEIADGLFHTATFTGDNLTRSKACDDALVIAKEKGWDRCPYNEGSRVLLRARFVQPVVPTFPIAK